MFFSLVCSMSGPMSSPRHGIQVHSVTIGSYKFYGWVSWSCFNCVITERLRVTVNPQCEVAWQPGKQVWVVVLISQQPTQRDKTCVRMLFTQKHIILIHVRHHVLIYMWSHSPRTHTHICITLDVRVASECCARATPLRHVYTGGRRHHLAGRTESR